nr:hypothetical protein [Parapedobacter soli]
MIVIGRLALFQQPLDEPRYIIKCPILEEVLPDPLHLDDEIFAIVATAMQVENNALILTVIAIVLIGCIFEFCNVLLPPEEVV